MLTKQKLKGTMKTAAIVVLSAALALSMAACGKGGDGESKTNNGGKSPEVALPEYSYTAEYSDLNVPENADFYRAKFVNGNMYYTTYEYDEETWTSTQTLHVYSLADDKEVSAFPLGGGSAEENVYQSVDNYTVRSDGSMLLIESVYDYRDPENAKNSFTLCAYDQDFNRGEEIDLIQAVKADENNFYVNQILCDGDDRVYVIADSKIYLFDADLKYQGVAEAGDSWINLSGMGKDGKVYVSMYDQGSNGMVVRLVDFDKKALGEVHTGFISGNGSNLTAGQEGDFLVSDGARVYDYSMADNKATELFAWLDCDIFGDYVRGMFVAEDSRIAVLMQDWSTNESSLVYLTKVKTEELPQKTQVTLGTLYASQDVLAAAVAFNKQSTDYHINVKYYMDQTDYSDDAYQNARTALNNALISADAPDMVEIGNVNIAPLAAKGAFEDLGAWLDKSSALKKSDYMENVLQAATYSNCLVYVPKNFYVQTLVGKTENVGTKSGWTMDDIMALAKANPDAALFEYATKEYMLNSCLMFNGDAFINYSTGKCNFDSEEFKKILEFVAAFPDEYEWSEDAESLPTLLREDKVLLDQVYISQLEDLQVYPAMFDAPVTFVGFPTTDGSAGCMLGANGAGLAITSKSAQKEGAWAFIEFYLSREDDMYSYGLPSNKKEMDKLIEEELKVEYLKDENGELVLDEEGNPISMKGRGGIGYGDWDYTYHNCTQEEIDEVQAVIAQARPASQLDDQILKIILEEAAPYFSKQKRVDEVTGVIQSRVQIYLSENQ
ncbi:MAG: extracellular solute-binding protein [Lachnospiraceae bacterium]|nr:extracellular solute-binding protein [Lachnospiraceae bacterium]